MNDYHPDPLAAPAGVPQDDPRLGQVSTPAETTDEEDFGEAYEHSPLALSRKQHEADGEMDITPMIDIVFLLLIFFLVASKMDPNSAVALPKARHGTAVVEKSSVVILVAEGSGDKALVTRENGDAFSDDLATQEDEIRDYVEKALASGKQYVLIKAERQVKQRHVSQVAKAIGLAPDAQQLYVAVMETK
jgi:biopolymer transport protein ExbD